ncbi:HEAT repeat domain-containing protein [Clostridium sp. LBM24168]
MLNVDWNKIDNYSEGEISYFLYLEGKNINAICKIRNLSREVVESQIIDGKIKYGILAKSKNEREFFKIVSMSGKSDKINALENLDKFNKNRLVEFIKCNYTNMRTRDKENAIWILGELRIKPACDILTKGVVHKHVNVRRMAVSALGKLGNKSGENALIRALDDDNPQVVMYAIKALIKIRSSKAVEKVKNIESSSCKVYVKNSAKEYLNSVKSF